MAIYDDDGRELVTWVEWVTTTGSEIAGRTLRHSTTLRWRDLNGCPTPRATVGVTRLWDRRELDAWLTSQVSLGAGRGKTRL